MKKILAVLFLLFASHAAFGYDFTYGTRTLNYNEDELKFYEGQKELSSAELSRIFNDYQIVLISEFDKNKKYKLKNSLFKSKKVLLLNDTKRTFHLFSIYPETARYSDNRIKSLITVYGKKNVRLKHFGGDEFVIDVR